MTTTAPDDSVTLWVHQLRDGDVEAAARLWELYAPRMARVARRNLSVFMRTVCDEEDVAVMAFHAFCDGLRQGRFCGPISRVGLWQLLMIIVMHHAIEQRRWHRMLEPGGGVVMNESVLAGPDGAFALDDLPEDRISPEEWEQLTDESGHRLRRLEDATLREVARLRLDGYSTEEIAEELGLSVRTIGRKLRRIREGWQVPRDDPDGWPGPGEPSSSLR